MWKGKLGGRILAQRGRRCCTQMRQASDALWVGKRKDYRTVTRAIVLERRQTTSPR